MAWTSDFDNAVAGRDELIGQWREAKRNLDWWKARENELRTTLVGMTFPNAGEGTHNLDLGANWKLKAVVKMNYALANKEGETFKAQQSIAQLSSDTAARIFKWSPELSISEYRKLTPELKAIVDSVLTIKPGMPTLELIEPPKV